MKMQNEAVDTIRICLEQRTIFMTSICDITKQLQVKAAQDEIQFGDLLDTRQDYMNRIDRCNALIQSQLGQLEGDENRLMRSVLDGSCEDIPEVFLPLKQQIEEYNRLLAATRVMDHEVIKLVQAKHTDLKERINAIRQKRANIETEKR
jgi:hypothetical protein